MKFAYDLHIHSVLSPCSDELMTPNNILNMAYLNELDIIAVTDHNSMRQLETVLEIAESYDYIVVPGIEIQVEGGHLLAYFSMGYYKAFSNEIEKILHKNDAANEQVVMDVFDLEVENYQYCLTGDLNSNLYEVLKLIKKYEGVTILAHIDKDKYSLKQLIKEEHVEYIDGIEVTKYVDLKTLYNDYPLLKDIPVYRSSDSHTITDLARRVNYIELEELSVEKFIEGLRR